jgi:molybdate transport system permease protein
MLPGIVSGCIVAFAASLGEFGATITFASNIEGETRTLPLAIYTAIQTPDGDRVALRLVMLSLLLAVGALALAEVADRRVRRMVGRS